MPGPAGGRFPFSNCILVEGPRLRILVDTGCHPWEHGFGEADVVVYTHFHPDHIRANHMVRAKRILAPRGEEPYTSLELLGVRFAGEEYRAWVEMARGLMELESPPRVDEYFEPGEDLCFRGTCLKTIPARGHLLTHTLVELPGRALYTVDIDLTGFGPWYGNPEASPALFLSDILMSSRLAARSYYTAHKETAFDRHGFINGLARFASRLVEQAEAVHKALKASGKPLRPRDLAGRGIIYRRYLGGLETIMEYFEYMMVEKLLGLLHTWGCVRQERAGFTARDCDIDAQRDSITGEVGTAL